MMEICVKNVSIIFPKVVADLTISAAKEKTTDSLNIKTREETIVHTWI